MNTLHKIANYMLDRMGEASTWQGIGFIVTLFGSKWGSLDWGQAAALGGIVSGLIKALLPDSFKKG